MGLHDPFGHFKHKLWTKKGSKIKLAIWLLTTKIGNHPDFLVWRWHATYLWKALDKGYNFALDLISIESFHRKLWAPKFARIPIVKISGLPLGSPETKWHLGASHVAMHKVYYKGEGGGFPQVRVVVSLVSQSLPVAHPNTKSVQAMH
jgi:hypothetical protein